MQLFSLPVLNKRIFRRYRFPAFVLMLLLPVFTRAQTDAEEVPIMFTVNGVGSTELVALVRDEKVALPVTEVFDFIRIRNTVSDGYKQVSGFFLDPVNGYTIDAATSTITYRGVRNPVPKEDLIHTGTNLYLDMGHFGRIFGLECSFNFRALMVTMNSKEELPVMREARLESMRRNIGRLTGEAPADTTIRYHNPFADLGIMNWNVILNQQEKGPSLSRGTFGFGGIFAGGELSAALNVSPQEKFEPSRQFYQWRYVNNENKIVRQVLAGKIPSQTIASLFGPLLGIQVNNRLTYARKSYSTYNISRTTNPGWDVELYVNQILVDYKKADSAGAYSFEIPLVYGNSDITLRFYGPYGETFIREERVTVPFQFLPKGQMEYSASAGIVEDNRGTQFSQGIVQYGLSKRLTAGAGAEYISTVTSTPVIPFFNASLRLGPRLLLFNEAAPGVRYRSQLSYRFLSNIQVDVNYTRYQKGQRVINLNALEERRAIISMPLRRRKFSATTMFTLNQLVLSSIRTTTAEWMFNTLVRGVNTQLTTYGIFTDHQEPLAYSNLSMIFRLPLGFRLTPTTQFQYNRQQFMFGRVLVEKNVFRTSTVNFFYERNLVANVANFGLGFIHDFDLAQVNISANRFNNRFSMFESFRGGIIYDRRTRYTRFNSKINVGRGALIVIPFLDVNCNGIRDAGEQKLPGLKLTMSGGMMHGEGKDTTIRISDLDPYNYYYLRIDKFSFDNIAWQISKPTIRISVEPNRYKQLYIPVAVVGEVSGMVYRKDSVHTKGQGQILVNFYRGDSLVAKVLSEPDGYFSYVGLPPGMYTVKIDPAQLQRMEMYALPEAKEIEIRPNPEGDIIEGLEFTIGRREWLEQKN